MRFSDLSKGDKAKTIKRRKKARPRTPETGSRLLFCQ